MARAFKHTNGVLTATEADIYTPGAGIVAIVTSFIVANIGTVTYNLTVTVEDNSAGTTKTLVNALPIPPNEAWKLPGTITLEASDSLRAYGDTTAVLDWNLGVLEDPLNAV